MINKTFLSLLAVSLFLFACNSTEIGDSKDIEPNAIAQQINVDYTEGEGLSAKIRFRVSGLNGTTLVLNKPAKVSFNNESLKLDSNSYYGAYYGKSLGSSTGKYEFSYTDKNGKTYQNGFNFGGFWLAKSMPTVINKNNNLEIEIKGLEPTAPITYNISDTAFGSDVHGTVNMIGNKLIIKQDALSKLKTGPIEIEIAHDKNEVLKNVTQEGGEIKYTYKMKKIKAKLQ